MLVPLGMAIAQERSSVSPAFSIAPLASYNIYSESFSMHSAMSYGGAVTMSLTSRIGVEFNAQFGQSQQRTCGSQGQEYLGASWARVSDEVQIELIADELRAVAEGRLSGGIVRKHVAHGFDPSSNLRLLPINGRRILGDEEATIAQVKNPRGTNKIRKYAMIVSDQFY